MNAKFKIRPPSKKTIILVVMIVVITVALDSLVAIYLSKYDNVRLPSVGTIYVFGYEVYGGNLTSRNGGQYINWGTTYPGTQTNCSIYLRSKSSVATIMVLETANWTYTNVDGQNVAPPQSNAPSLSWDYDNVTMLPNQEIYVTMTLSVSNDNAFIEYLIVNRVVQFSFNIQISPSQVQP